MNIHNFNLKYLLLFNILFVNDFFKNRILMLLIVKKVNLLYLHLNRNTYHCINLHRFNTLFLLSAYHIIRKKKMNDNRF